MPLVVPPDNRRPSPVPAWLLSLGVVLGLACGGAEGPTGPVNPTPTVAQVTLTPSSASLVIGTTRSFTAEVRSSANTVMTGQTVVWSVSDTSVLSVAGGVVTAKRVGSATVVGAVGSVQGSASVAVIPPPVASVVVSPATATLVAGESVLLTATVKDSAGGTLGGPAPTWSSSDTLLATVSLGGIAFAKRAGTVTITATRDGKSGSAVLTILPRVGSVVVSPATATLAIGATTTLTATVKDSAGATLTGRTVAWSSSNAAVATVSSSGVVTAVASGTATITATSEGKSANAVVTVTAATSEYRLTGATSADATFLVDDDITVYRNGSAIFTDNNGLAQYQLPIPFQASPGDQIRIVVKNVGMPCSVLDEVVLRHTGSSSSVTLTSGFNDHCTSSPVGVFFDQTFYIPALDGMTGTVTLSPATATVPVGSTSTLALSATSGTGGTRTPSVASWSSNATSVATVSQSGVVTGVAPGTATITASSDGKRATATVTVVAAVANVTVSPVSATITIGATQQLSAVTKDASGATLTGRTVAWTSSDTLLASVNATGLVTAKRAGSVTVTATSEGKSGTAALTLVAPIAPVASVVVSPASASVAVAASTSLTAVTKDSTGATLTGRTVTWSSSNTSVATVSVSGVVAGVAAGSATITASSEGKSGTASVTVTPPAPVASVTVTPSTTSLTVGSTFSPLIATLRDASGNQLSRPVTWSSGNTGVATVDWTTGQGGYVVATGPGTATVGGTSEGVTGTATVTVTGGVAPVILAQTVSSGLTHSCGLTAAGAAYCWGQNFQGQLGIGSTSTTASLSPVAVAGGLTFKSISVGDGFTIALTASGVAYGWGENSAGQVGGSNCGPATSPVPVSGGLTFVRVSAGSQHAMAITTSGDMYGWGSDLYGELGNGSEATHYCAPQRVVGSATWKTVSAGQYFTLGLTTGGVAYSWGLNKQRQLGIGSGDPAIGVDHRLLPGLVANGQIFSFIGAGPDFGVALTPGGVAYTWGVTLSFDWTRGRNVPQPVFGFTFKNLSLGGSRILALTADGTPYSWGQAYLGSDVSLSEVPILVSGGLKFVQVTAGESQSLGITSTGAVYGWGQNGHGEVGDGTTTFRATPVPVSFTAAVPTSP